MAEVDAQARGLPLREAGMTTTCDCALTKMMALKWLMAFETEMGQLISKMGGLMMKMGELMMKMGELMTKMGPQRLMTKMGPRRLMMKIGPRGLMTKVGRLMTKMGGEQEMSQKVVQYSKTRKKCQRRQVLFAIML
jgi:hypothetical protein